MPKKADVCDVPGCGRPVTNKSRGLCSRCDANRHYWRRKRKENKQAVALRMRKLSFWNDRLNWLFEKRHGE